MGSDEKGKVSFFLAENYCYAGMISDKVLWIIIKNTNFG